MCIAPPAPFGSTVPRRAGHEELGPLLADDVGAPGGRGAAGRERARCCGSLKLAAADRLAERRNLGQLERKRIPRADHPVDRRPETRSLMPSHIPDGGALDLARQRRGKIRSRYCHAFVTNLAAFLAAFFDPFQVGRGALFDVRPAFVAARLIQLNAVTAAPLISPEIADQPDERRVSEHSPTPSEPRPMSQLNAALTPPKSSPPRRRPRCGTCPISCRR